eukprot:2287566-Rhodomonas_salina.2
MLQHDGGDEGLAAGSSTQLVTEGGVFVKELVELLNSEELRIIAASLTPGASSGSKEDIASSIAENTDLTMVDIENADLLDLLLAQLMLAAAGCGLNIKGDHQETESEIASFLNKLGLNAVGDFATLKQLFKLYCLGLHPINFEAMALELDQLMDFVDLFGLRLDETCPRGTIVDALVAVRSASAGANLLQLKRWSKELA